MPPEIISLIGVFVVGAAAGMTIERFLSDKRWKAYRARNRPRWKKRGDTGIASGPWLATKSPPDAAEQLRIVMGASFSIQSLLNKREARLFKVLDRTVIDINPAWQVMAQVSLGEILSSKDAEAYQVASTRNGWTCCWSTATAGLAMPSNTRAAGIIRAPRRHEMRSRRKRCDARESATTRSWLAILLRRTSGDWSRNWWTGRKPSNSGLMMPAS